jgi:hypothetical protein
MSPHKKSEAAIIEDVAWKAIRKLGSRLQRAGKVVTPHAPLVIPDVVYLTVETLEEALEELKEKLPGRDERYLLEEFRASLVRLKWIVDALVAEGTIALFDLVERRRRGASGRAGPEG